MKLRVEYSVVGDNYEVTMTVSQINGFSVFALGYMWSDSRKSQNESRTIMCSEFSKEKDDNKLKVNQLVSFTYVQEPRFRDNDSFETILLQCDKNNVSEIMELVAKVTEIKEAIEVGFEQHQKCKELDRMFSYNTIDFFEISENGKFERKE